MTASRTELKREIAALRKQRSDLAAEMSVWRLAATVAFALAALASVAAVVAMIV